MSTFQIKTVSLTAISTDNYQRKLDPERVEHIADTFEAAQWDLPKVVEIEDEGHYRVVAGMHRVEVARTLLARGAWPFDTPGGYIEVQAVAGVDHEDEADLFLDDAGNKKPIAPYFKHRAALGGQKSPRHERAVDIQVALDRYSIPLVQRQRAMTGSSFVAINSLNALWSSCRGNAAQVIDETLHLAQMWKADDIYRFEGSLVGGLGIVVRDLLKSEGHIGRLIRMVEKTTALTIAGKALAYSGKEQAAGRARPSLSQPLTYAAVIRDLLPRAKPAAAPSVRDRPPRFDVDAFGGPRKIA